MSDYARRLAELYPEDVRVPRPARDAAGPGLPTAEAPPAAELAPSRAPAPPVLALADLLRNPALLAPPACVVPHLAWEGRLTLLSATEKTGKSTLVGQAVAAMQTGDPFLGRAPTRGPVLWLALDEPLGDTVRRLTDYGARDGVFFLEQVVERTELHAAIEAVRPRLVVIDTLREFAAGRVQDFRQADGWTLLLRDLREPIRRHHAACVLLHHTVRDGSRYADSGQIGAGVDVILEMTGEANDPSLRKVAFRGRGVGHGLHRLRFAQDSRYYLDAGELPLELRVLRLIEAHPGIGKRDLRERVGGRVADTDRALAELVRQDLVVNTGDASRHAYTRRPPQNAGTRSGHARDTLGVTRVSDDGTRADTLGTRSGHARVSGPLIAGAGTHHLPGGQEGAEMPLELLEEPPLGDAA